MKSMFGLQKWLPVALALTATALGLGTTSAQAQRAALVQSVDEPGRNPYQELLSDPDCRGTTVCVVNFSTVPAGKRLVVTHVAGYVDTGVGTLPNGFLSSSFGGSQYATVPFTGVRGARSNLGVRIFINQPVLAYFGAGETPRGVYHVTGTGDTMSGGNLLMLSGYLVSVP